MQPAHSPMSDTRLYHDPRCSKSRAVIGRPPEQVLSLLAAD